MKTIGILFVALMLLAGPANIQLLAADLPVGKPSTTPSLAGSDSVDASCMAWTDGCRICQRVGAEVTCSNIGIACQPGKDRCTARQDGKKSP